MKVKYIFSPVLLPASWIYGIIVLFRNFLFDAGILRETRFDIPVISVGNITVGGTGKTPHVEYLIRLLQDHYRIAVLSRGYKRKTKGFILSSQDPSSDIMGDEPCQIKRKFPHIVVAVDTDRVHGIRKIMQSDVKVDLILLDDAFQHRYVKPGLSILLADHTKAMHSDFLLPFGRLREPARNAKRADIIIVTRWQDNGQGIDIESARQKLRLKAEQTVFFTRMEPSGILPVFNAKSIIPEELFIQKYSVLAVSGIANPFEFRKFAGNMCSGTFSFLEFRDHHSFTSNDISRIQNVFERFAHDPKILLTTEKDAVRFMDQNTLPEVLKTKMYYLPVKTTFFQDQEKEFNRQILDYVKKNQRNSIIY